MGYVQPWVKEVAEWVNGTIEGNGMWKSEGVTRSFKTALYIYIYIYIYTDTGCLQKNGAVSKINNTVSCYLTCYTESGPNSIIVWMCVV
jgi:hypothetical protein